MSEPKNNKLRQTFLSFGLIGVFNTLLDVVIYVILNNLTHSIIFSNIVATTVAVSASYVLNSRITFKFKKWTLKSILTFVAVTLFGLWILQTGLIYALTTVTNTVLAHIKFIPRSLLHTSKILLPKLIATAFSFVWNFIWYSKVIFKNDNNNKEESIKLSSV